MSESVESRRAPEPVGAFPHAKRVGNFLFLSGIGPLLRGSKEIPGVTRDASGTIVSYDIEKQCRAVFENVRLVLEALDEARIRGVHGERDFHRHAALEAEVERGAPQLGQWAEEMVFSGSVMAEGLRLRTYHE